MTDSPVGYWRLGEPGGATTAVNVGTAGAKLNGAYSPAKTDAPGLIANDSDTAAAFNGSGTQVSGGGISTAAPGGTSVFAGDWTIEAWLVRDSVTSWSAVFSNNNGSTAAPLMTFIDSTHQLGINGAGVTANNVSVDLGQYGGTANPTAYLGKPVYAVITKTGGNGSGTNSITVKANVDGTWLPTVTGSTSWNLVPGNGFFIGRHFSGATQIHDGTLDEVAIYANDLSAQQMMAHYAAASLNGYSAKVVSDGPIGYWRLGEAGGATTAANSGWAGTTLDGTYNPTSPGKVNAPGLIQNDPDTAAALDGSTAYISGSGLNTAAPGGTNPFAGDWTIETWFVRDSATGDWEGVFSNNAVSGEGGGAPLMTFFDGVSGRSRHWLGMNGAGVSATPDIYVDLDQFGGGGEAYLDKPVYAVMTLTGSQLDMVVNVDGVWLTAATTTLGRTLDTDNDSFLIGRHYWGGPQLLDGTIDEVAIYNRALSGDEIFAHYMASVPEPGTFVLLALGVVSLAGVRVRLRKGNKRRSGY